MKQRYMLVVTANQLDWLSHQLAASDVAFEIRLDSFPSPPDFKAIRARTQAPLLATFRSRHHCGLAEAHARDSRGWEWRKAALAAGFDGVDVELDETDVANKLATIRAKGGFSVLSHHETEHGKDLLVPLEQALRLGADVTKIIGSGASLSDFDQQRVAYEQAQDAALVCFYMGAEFAASRWLSLRYGAPFTFVMPDHAAEVAPGVPSLALARSGYAMASNQNYDALFAVVGTPIGHSQSPKFHNPLLRNINRDALFLAIPTPSGALQRMLATFPECRGLAVTKPLKEEAFAFADGFFDEAIKELGAINTLVKHAEQWLGANTDYAAMLAILSQVPQAATLRVLGYGGLGKAVVLAGLTLGLNVEVSNRSQGRLENVDARVRVIAWEDRHGSGPYVVVQATSVGMEPNAQATPLDEIPASVKLFVETIYNPQKTRLLTMAEAKGIAVRDGLELFQKQAEIQNGYFKDVARQP